MPSPPAPILELPLCDVDALWAALVGMHTGHAGSRPWEVHQPASRRAIWQGALYACWKSPGQEQQNVKLAYGTFWHDSAEQRLARSPQALALSDAILLPIGAPCHRFWQSGLALIRLRTQHRPLHLRKATPTSARTRFYLTLGPTSDGPCLREGRKGLVHVFWSHGASDMFHASILQQVRASTKWILNALGVIADNMTAVHVLRPNQQSQSAPAQRTDRLFRHPRVRSQLGFGVEYVLGLG